MKKLLLISLIILFFVPVGLALNISDDTKNYPYRIFIGDNYSTDWVDVYCVGYIFNKEYKTLFEDKSLIQEIYLDEDEIGKIFYWIVKKKSIWKFYDDGLNSRLILVEPKIPKGALIYER